MDEDYFTSFPVEDIAAHLRICSRVTSKEPVQVQIRQSSTPGEFDVVAVGFDYPSAFSVLCGLLAAFGLDIQSGDIYSFGTQALPSSKRKIVDVFHVRANPNAPFNSSRQESFITEIQKFSRLLATGDLQEPRERLNRFLVESLERLDEPLSGLLCPIEIEFDNQLSSDWTVMETHSKDAFAF